MKSRHLIMLGWMGALALGSTGCVIHDGFHTAHHRPPPPPVPPPAPPPVVVQRQPEVVVVTPPPKVVVTPRAPVVTHPRVVRVESPPPAPPPVVVVTTPPAAPPPTPPPVVVVTTPPGHQKIPPGHQDIPPGRSKEPQTPAGHTPPGHTRTPPGLAKKEAGQTTVIFTSQERTIIHTHMKNGRVTVAQGQGQGNKHKGGVPPGQAKKAARTASLPPDWQTRCVVGQVMPQEVYRQCEPLPQEVVVKLPPPPPGTIVVTLDSKVVRLAHATLEILDVFDVFN